MYITPLNCYLKMVEMVNLMLCILPRLKVMIKGTGLKEVFNVGF